MSKTCKILLLGKTGVGKSALLNYLAGERLAESGIATSSGGITRGINRYPIRINGHDCMVADSEGLETGDYDTWKKIIDVELEKTKSSGSVLDWYHIVIFCISAGGGRVESSELNIIEQLAREGYGVIIAFTKSDQSSEEDTEKLRSEISAGLPTRKFAYVDVCSVSKRGMDSFGKEDLSEAIVRQWKRTLINRLPEHIYDWAIDSLKSRKKDIKNWVWEQDMGFLGRSTESVSSDVSRKTQAAIESLSSEMEARYQAAVDDIHAVMTIFDAIFPKFLSSTSGLGSVAVVQGYTSGGDLLMGGLCIAGTLFAIGIVPVVIPIAILKAVFDDGSKKKKKICEAIDDNFYSIRKSLLSQKEEFQKKLAESYGEM